MYVSKNVRVNENLSVHIVSFIYIVYSYHIKYNAANQEANICMLPEDTPGQGQGHKNRFQDIIKMSPHAPLSLRGSLVMVNS